jgi:hypothetical protein
MSILATKPDLEKIITKAVKRIGENHALARDNKGVEFKASEIEEDRKEFRKDRVSEINSVIEESLKAVADEMAEKMVLENTIDGMIKDVITEQRIGYDTDFNRLSSEDEDKKKLNILQKFDKFIQTTTMKNLSKKLASTDISMEDWKNALEAYRHAKGRVEDLEGITPEDYVDYKEKGGEETRVNESTTHIIKKLVTKKLKDKLGEGRHPGYDAYEKAVKKSKTENVKAMKDTKKKFKEYENFEGNENPEFPHQEMSQTNADGQYQYYRNDEKQQEFVDDFAHPGLIDFDINNVNMDRLTKYLEGSIETGNAQTDSDGKALGNVVPSDLGEKMLKSMKRRKEKIADQKDSMTNLRGITPDVQKVKQVKEDVNIDVEIMKKLWDYNKKTQ